MTNEAPTSWTIWESVAATRGAAPKCTRTRLLAVERSEAARTRTAGDRRSLFDRFVQTAHRRVSQAPFFFVCAGIVAIWLVSLPLWEDLKEWQTAIHTVASVLTLLLVVLLENAGRRAEEAAQEKLNVIAEALAELMTSEARTDPDLREAAKRLRDAVALEERH
jgi:low affinity Fe/Cu permease